MRGSFERFFGQPAAGDDGTALGAASLVWHQVLGNARNPGEILLQDASLGPSITDLEIKQAIKESDLLFRKSASVAEEVARLIADGRIVGWYQGRSEFGPRALGNRSILADPRDASMKDKINSKVKFREGFRPFAPAILQERTAEFFECAHPSPFMNLVFPIKAEKQALIPAVTHVDGTGRLQTETAESNPRFNALIQRFEALTGVPVVLNTSFNIKGEPIVNTPMDAIKTFHSSGIDCLVLGDYVLQR
jgi:carbamoyltransferase